MTSSQPAGLHLIAWSGTIAFYTAACALALVCFLMLIAVSWFSRKLIIRKDRHLRDGYSLLVLLGLF